MGEKGDKSVEFDDDDYVEVCPKLPENGDVREGLRMLVGLNCSITKVSGCKGGNGFIFFGLICSINGLNSTVQNVSRF